MPVHSAPVASFEQDDHPGLARNLERDLREERDIQFNCLVSAKDWADFQRRRGIVEGLEIAISRCERSKKLLEG
jgi:hypothetical protein